MKGYFALREKPLEAPYKKGDVLVLFGELFNRGYANGLVEEAEKLGLKVIYATVGRREKNGELRALNAEEIKAVPQPENFINIPLEAGFDMEASEKGPTPIDLLKDVKLHNWKEVVLDPVVLESAQSKSIKRFRQNTSDFMLELEKHLSPGKNVLFAHLMAGGVPRTKIVMPLMNRVFKGIGERYLSSEEFWTSSIGQFCQTNFKEVTAETFRHLLELSTPLKEKIESKGGHVSYVAYGYHGTEVFLKDQYLWQTYTPYLQGWAKKDLENGAREYYQKGYNCCVYNCPEILTNSSSIFQGVEVCLYPLTRALSLEAPKSPKTPMILEKCRSLLKSEITFQDIWKKIDAYSSDPLIRDHCQFEQWPQHSQAQQMEKMLALSEELIAMHSDSKQLMTAVLSELVFESCGFIMMHESWKPRSPVSWINHDLVARCLN